MSIPCKKCICLPACRGRFSNYPYKVNGVYALVDRCSILDESVKVITPAVDPRDYTLVDYPRDKMNAVINFMLGRDCDLSDVTMY